jgi:hypothetical protein
MKGMMREKSLGKHEKEEMKEIRAIKKELKGKKVSPKKDISKNIPKRRRLKDK